MSGVPRSKKVQDPPFGKIDSKFYKMNINLDKNYEHQLEKYRDHLLTLGHNPLSVGIKENYLKEFFEQMHLRGIRKIENITAEHIKEYQDYIQSRPNKRTKQKLNIKTINNHFRSIELFFMMLLDRGEIQINPLSEIQIHFPEENTERTILSKSQIKSLYDHTKSEIEKVILGLGYGCGMRVTEIVQCNIEDLQLKQGIIIIPRGNNNKRRVIPITQQVIKDLECYLNEVRMYLGSKDVQALLINSKGRRLQKYTMNKILKQIIRRTKDKTINPDEITMHTLRHSIATHLLEQGMPLQQVRQFLGHDQLETTEIYTHINQEQLRKLITKDNETGNEEQDGLSQ